MTRKRRDPTNWPIGLSEHMRGKRNYSVSNIKAMVAAVCEPPPVGVLPPNFSYGNRPKAEVLTVLRRKELAARVERAAIEFAHEVSWQARPSPSQLSKELNRIATAGRRLMQTLANSVTDADGRLIRTNARHALQEQFERWAEASQGYPSVFPDLLPTKFEVHGYSGTDYAQGVALQRCVAAAKMLTRLAASAEQLAHSKIRAGRPRHDAPHQGDVALRGFIHELSKIYADVFDKRPSAAVDGPGVRFLEAALQPLGINKSRDAIAGILKINARKI